MKVNQRAPTSQGTRKSNAFTSSVLRGNTPVVPDLSQATEPQQDLYNTASVVHKQPGRLRRDASALIEPLATRKQQLAHVEKTLLRNPSDPQPTALRQTTSVRAIRKVPISKADGELLIFKQVFVRPQEEILDSVKTKLAEHRSEVLRRNPRLQTLMQRPQSTPALLQTSAEKTKSDRSYFSQQIQVQPPEGLNASVAAPLTPGGGWAPSIPAGNSSLSKANLKDMTMRATAGVQAGDVQKEAHMSYCLGVLNEQKQSYKEAAKFYKRFFFCARLLDDPIGAALGLNRLGVLYHNMGKCEKSLQFHMKHFELADKENRFAALYNLGITHRFLINYTESLSFLTQALAWATERQEAESECISLGQLGLTSQLKGDAQEAYKYFQVRVTQASLEVAAHLKNDRLQLDTLLSLGYLAYQLSDLPSAIAYFSAAVGVTVMQNSKTLLEAKLATLCCCNVGIVEGERAFEDKRAELLRTAFDFDL